MKRKLLSVLVTVCMLLTLLPAAGLTASADYSATYTMTALYNGTATLSGGDIVSISTAEELGYLSSYVNAGNKGEGGTFYLTDNIDLNPGVTFTFNADTGLVTVSDGTDTFWLGAGVKGNTSGSNTTFDEIASTKGEIYTDQSGTTGAAPFNPTEWTPIGENSSHQFAGTFDGNGKTVSGIYISGTSSYIGLFGYTTGAVKYVDVVDSYISGSSSVGGVVGCITSGTVSYCSNSGSIFGSRYAGGVVGYITSGTVSYCSNSGSISGSSFNVGGVVGCIKSGTVSNCCNTGCVNGSSNRVGGVVGLEDGGTVLNCYNTGYVKGNCYVGGVVGYNCGTVKVSYNAGRMEGGMGTGGVVGYNNSGTVSYCYNSGFVEGYGGVAGLNSGSISFCYYDKQICTIEGINGEDITGQAEGKSTLELVGKGLWTNTSGEGWTDECWTFSEKDIYPCLAGMAETDAAYISAAPLMLSYTSPSEYETANTVASSVTVGTNNGVTWYDNSGDPITGNSTLTVTTAGITITAKLNNLSKEVLLKSSSNVTIPAAPPSSEAELLSVWTRTDYETSGTGASTADPVLWDIGEVDVTALSLTDITTSDDATVKLYSDSAFSAEITGPDTLAIPTGETTTAYIKVTAQDGNNTVYYAVSFTRAVVIWDGTTVASAFSGGTGTFGDPYQIGSGAELAYLAQVINDSSTNGTYSSLYYELTDDIYLNENASDYETWGTSAPSHVWTPIGNDVSSYSSTPFSGHFNGNGYTVSGIYINCSESYQGLFGYVDGGTIKNLGIIDSYVAGCTYVGGVAGSISNSVSKVQYCYNTGCVSGNTAVGSIVGFSYNSSTKAT